MPVLLSSQVLGPERVLRRDPARQAAQAALDAPQRQRAEAIPGRRRRGVRAASGLALGPSRCAAHQVTPGCGAGLSIGATLH